MSAGIGVIIRIHRYTDRRWSSNSYLVLRRRRENHWAKPDLYINRFCRKKTLRFGEDCFMTSSWNLFFFSNQRSFTFLLRWTIIIINFPQLQEITLMIREDKTKKNLRDSYVDEIRRQTPWWGGVCFFMTSFHSGSIFNKSPISGRTI